MHLPPSPQTDPAAGAEDRWSDCNQRQPERPAGWVCGVEGHHQEEVSWSAHWRHLQAPPLSVWPPSPAGSCSTPLWGTSSWSLMTLWGGGGLTWTSFLACSRGEFLSFHPWNFDFHASNSLCSVSGLRFQEATPLLVCLRLSPLNPPVPRPKFWTSVTEQQ